jgi:hypothetical protein
MVYKTMSQLQGSDVLLNFYSSLTAHLRKAR